MMHTKLERLCCVNFTKYFLSCSEMTRIQLLCNELYSLYGIPISDYYLLQNGKKLTSNDTACGLIHIVPRLCGGKGGFGSMLRAIGAQIEKTTNREACRDLSGRRLRDINEEQRLKNWIAQQAEREEEAAERRRLKLEKLCREPKHDFSDEFYEKERSELTAKISDSVEEGLKRSRPSASTSKRPATDAPSAVKKKKRLLIDLDDEFPSSDSDNDGNPVETFKNMEQTKHL